MSSKVEFIQDIKILTTKKIVIFGDSIAKGDHSNGGIFAKSIYDSNITIYNYAENGAYMIDEIPNNLSDQYKSMINDGIIPDMIVFMFHFNEISKAHYLMNKYNSIGFPRNNDRNTSIGNLEYWIEYTLLNYPQCKMCFINYPIKVAHNPRSFFNAQFEYALYLLGELYGIPICNMKNSGISFDENAIYYTNDGLHFNAIAVTNILYPFIKSFFRNNMSVRNEEPLHCIGLFGNQITVENYVAVLSKLANVYGKKDFARSFDGIYFYTKEDTTDTTVKFGHLINNFKQMFGSFGSYWESNVNTLIRYNYYQGSYNEISILRKYACVSGLPTSNLILGECTIESDSDNLKIAVSIEVGEVIQSEEIGTHTCMKIFNFNSNDIFRCISANRLKRLGVICIATFSNYQPIYYGLGLLVNDDCSASLYIVDGFDNYSYLKSGGCNIFTCKSLTNY